MRVLAYLFHASVSSSLTVIARKIPGHRATHYNTLVRRFSSCEQENDMTKIGINGFGRIGRLVLRASLDRPGAQVGREREVTDRAASVTP